MLSDKLREGSNVGLGGRIKGLVGSEVAHSLGWPLPKGSEPPSAKQAPD